MQPAAEFVDSPLDLEIDIEGKGEATMKDQEIIERYGLSTEQWEACEKAASQIREKFAPALAKAIKALNDQTFSEINDYLTGDMESDTTYNFRSMVRERTETIMKGLLNGDWNEDTAKQWLENYDFEKFRLDVYNAHRETIQNKLIEDLQRENKTLTERLELRERY
jgi:tRNA(Met) C34 N-acetyltransferase TmcA